jgi:hypothetical protein
MKKSKFVHWLEKRSFTINEFIELVKRDRTTVWNWRKGLKRPHPKTMRKIRDITNGEVFDPEDLVDK